MRTLLYRKLVNDPKQGWHVEKALPLGSHEWTAHERALLANYLAVGQAVLKIGEEVFDSIQVELSRPAFSGERHG